LCFVELQLLEACGGSALRLGSARDSFQAMRNLSIRRRQQAQRVTIAETYFRGRAAGGQSAAGSLCASTFGTASAETSFDYNGLVTRD
jgi:hypothetical protein